MESLPPHKLQRRIRQEYHLPRIRELFITHEGLNVLYRIETEAEAYVLKLYRPAWRNREEILFEVDVLLHLLRKNIPVGAPVVTREGDYLLTVNDSPHPRYGVLYRYVRGESHSLDNERSYRLGRAAAALHHATNDFTSGHPRFHLDLDHLLEQPLQALRSETEHRPHDRQFLENLREEIIVTLDRSSPKERDWGFCHGDLNGSNVFYEGETTTLIDFDCGGMGWRAYDLAAFQSFLITHKETSENAETLWQSFITGYLSRRELPDADLHTVHVFVALRKIWALGLHVSTLKPDQRIPHFFDRTLQFLRGWKLS